MFELMLICVMKLCNLMNMNVNIKINVNLNWMLSNLPSCAIIHLIVALTHRVTPYHKLPYRHVIKSQHIDHFSIALTTLSCIIN
jgi:hypothetical protein